MTQVARLLQSSFLSQIKYVKEKKTDLDKSYQTGLEKLFSFIKGILCKIHITSVF